MKVLALATLLSALATAANAADPAPPHWRGMVYIQIVTPVDADLLKQVTNWTPSVKNDFQREVVGVSNSISKLVGPDDQLTLQFNKQMDAKTVYQKQQLVQIYDWNNSISISVLENVKNSSGRIFTNVDVYFGELKGNLPEDRLTYSEAASLASSDRAVTELKYMFIYAWASDFVRHKKKVPACALFAKGRELEPSASIRTNQSLAPLRAEMAKSYAALSCQTLVATLNAPTPNAH